MTKMVKHLLPVFVALSQLSGLADRLCRSGPCTRVLHPGQASTSDLRMLDLLS